MVDKKVNETIFKIIKDSISVIYSEVDILEDSHLIDDLGFDSITLVQLIIEIEEKFNIEMDDAEYEQIVKVNTLIEYVNKKLRKVSNDDNR